VKARGKTATPTPSPRFGAEDSINEISVNLESSSRDQKWLKRVCLGRENNRCILTGLYDSVKAMGNPEIDPIFIATTKTEIAHIIPFSLGNFEESEVNFFLINYAALPLICQ